VGRANRVYRDFLGPPGVGHAIAALAAVQHGVVLVEQLRDLGLDADAIARRVAAGLLHRIHHGVYAVGHPRLTAKGRYFAAVSACGPRAALSHQAAAYLHDLRPRPARIDVSAPRSRAGPAEVRVHRSRMLDATQVTTIDNIPVTTIDRTLLDLAAVLDERQLARAVDRAERLELLNLLTLMPLLERARGRKGAKALRRALAAYELHHTREELEHRFRELIQEHALPMPQFNAIVAGHEVDAYWPDHDLVVELDSWSFHRTRADHERDMVRDADLELAGMHLSRIDWKGVTVRARQTAARIRAATGG
jgi:predicted transcriptional regulator of viral defense system